MAKIIVGRCDKYDVAGLSDFVASSLAEIGLSFSNCRVLLKPNLVSGKAPGKAVNTHPLLVRAVAEVLLERDCRVFVGDSPGYESTEKALEKSGIMDVIRRLHLDVASFNRRVTKLNRGVSPYRELCLGEDPLDYDVVINLPKLKTHMMMGLTAGVKNCFGFVPHLDKAKWHLRCGADKNLFASLLIDVHAVVKPTVTILDGVIAMDTNGPSHGRPRDIGLLAVSDDALCLDAHLESMLSIPHPLPITVIAREKGLLHDLTVTDKGAPKIADFRMPSTLADDFSLPLLVKETAKIFLTKKPKCNRRKCTLCRTCLDVCPAGALTASDQGLVFDYKRCIKCYCCAEMCPAGAITV
jgi:uncharacterized protein (DUF362 family)/NAD-dependent dihydropyrimidine dehydrogenase PreA subunit